MQVLLKRTKGYKHFIHFVAIVGEHCSHLGSHPMHTLLSVVKPRGH